MWSGTILNYVPKEEINILQKISPHLSHLNVAIKVQIGNFLGWKGLPNVQILFCLHKHKVLLICNENKEIYVANLMIQ